MSKTTWRRVPKSAPVGLQRKKVRDQVVEFLIAQSGDIAQNIPVIPFRKDIAQVDIIAVVHIGGSTPYPAKRRGVELVPGIVIGFRPDIVKKSVGKIFPVVTVGTPEFFPLENFFSPSGGHAQFSVDQVRARERLY